MEPPKPPPLKRPAGSGSMRTVPPPLPPARARILPWVCLGGSFVFLGVVASVIVWRVISYSRTGTEMASTPMIVPSVDDKSPAPDPAAIAASLPSEVTTPDDPLQTSTADHPPVVEKPSVPTIVNPVETPVAVSESPAFAELRRRSATLELPGRGLMRDSTEVVLATLPVPEQESLQLALSADSAIKLTQPDRSDDQSWTAVKQARDAFGGQEEVTLGRFSHREGELRFQWDPGAPAWAKPASLQFTNLIVTVGTQKQTCQLWKPIVVNPIRISPQAMTTADTPLAGEYVDRPQSFHTQFQLAGLTQGDMLSAVGSVGETAKITINGANENAVDVEIKTTLGDSRGTLQIRLFSNVPAVGKEGEIRLVRQEISPMIVQSHQRQGRVKDQKKRESEVEKLRNQIAGWQKQIAAKETGSQNLPFNVREQNEAEIAVLTKRIEMAESKAIKLETELAAATEFSQKMMTWCDDAGAILKNLEDVGQLRYAVYVDTVPRTVVVETSGFVWNKQ